MEEEKTMKEILIIVKETYERYVALHAIVGLCFAAKISLNAGERNRFADYLTCNRKFLFIFKRSLKCYMWPRTNVKARIKWLDKHIKINS